jgi:cellulose synthase/poly-beta-1,6-N-acetylglucosamine synthase-like glycosyltransferase
MPWPAYPGFFERRAGPGGPAQTRGSAPQNRAFRGSFVIAKAVFWVAAAVVAYVFAGYPLLLWLLERVFGRPSRKRPIEPSVSILVAAFNEARVIAAKIRNAAAIDYPPERLEIVIASDGSTDGTPEIAGRVIEELSAGNRVRAIAFPVNRGKLTVLNEVVPSLRGEIVVFSDAASMLEPLAIRRLVAHFADPEVGAAGGLYRVSKQDEEAIGRQEDFYWKYETFLKGLEASLGAMLGAHGALYAVRKSLYPYPHPGLINDDYIIPVRILQQGYRVVYEPSAVATEEAREMGGFGRRVRIMAGNFQQLREIAGFLWPLRPLPLLASLSHKLGRLVVPFAMVAGLVSNAFLTSSAFYLVTAALQIAFYGLAGVGALWPLRPKVLRLPYYFCMINIAVVPGLYWALAGRSRAGWKRA